MKVKRAASIPLITHDPYFSVWSSADRLYEDVTRHWSYEPLRMYGFLVIDSQEYCFMGRKADRNYIRQISLDVTATSTEYVFENDEVCLTVTFTSPLLPDDLKIFSRPCSYVRFRAEKKKDVKVSVRIELSKDFIKCTDGPVFGGCHSLKIDGQDTFSYAYMYKGNQHILGHSGDNLTIDWGNVYLGTKKGELSFHQREEKLAVETELEDQKEETVIVGFDDILSINYLGDAKGGYWKKFYRNLPEAIAACLFEEQEILKRCKTFDEKIEEEAEKAGGEDYKLLCNFSYRQVMAGHKLIADNDGNPVFLSKECDSNGCIGTVDISYPSIPLLLWCSTELAKALLRPVFTFAGSPVWCFDFAPHDLGRYPYATGQIYGLLRKNQWAEYTEEQGMIYPFYANFPDGREVYDFKTQMPVEESGNMLIMSAAICCMEQSDEFVRPYMPFLEKWVNYLVRHGKDPDEQLCTDDFAGHLNHNVNLAAKAVMGIEAYAQILKLQGREEEYAHFHELAGEYAAYWEEHAAEDNHTLLAYDREGSWSLKYNTIWDRFFGSGFFSAEVFEREVRYYIQKSERYGTPLDSRKKYTKSDWILWCSAMTDDRALREKLISPVAGFLCETKNRIPFSDWYDVETGDYCHFKGRPVQGGIFMPMLLDSMKVHS